MPTLPPLSLSEIAAISRVHLEAVIAIESSSDERSTTIPSTEGQRELSRYLERFFLKLGASVRVDAYANMIASIPGRGALAQSSPLALMIHLDTARGTEPETELLLLPAWDGSAIPYPDNARLQVSVANYPCTQPYVGHDLLHGRGKAPFGLDDKLGLAHLMTLAKLLADHPDIPHRPLLLIGRPDEEIGREDALIGLAKWLADEGVDSGYTVDGLDPFEINLENFNGIAASLQFVSELHTLSEQERTQGEALTLHLHGVNTHGATAHAEGHRGALRFACELQAALQNQAIQWLSFESDTVRDCDATMQLWLADHNDRHALEEALQTIVGPHGPRGAAWSLSTLANRAPLHKDPALPRLLDFIHQFIASGAGTPLWCEDSQGFEGYSHPYRARRLDGLMQLDIRIRDFDRISIQARCEHLRSIAADLPLEIVDQYDNMASKLAHRHDLLDNALAAAHDLQIDAKKAPIRGGTGIDPFLDRGVFIANLGTGYFAPESEKEFTSMQFLAQHALWLLALVQR